MRLPAWFVMAILWQSPVVLDIGSPAAPEYLRFQREVAVPEGATGVACLTLDAPVLAHTASAAHNDLRLYRRSGGAGGESEIPYLLTESGPEPVAAAVAAVEHMSRTGNALRFDLHMPPRAYSEVQLRLGLHNFVGTVVVTGDRGHGRAADLGSFGIFDLQEEGLGQWTSLELAETTEPLLHVELRLRTPTGSPLRELPPGVLQSATVPPSRERQTRYTPVAVTDRVTRRAKDSVATLRVPAHVPIERIRFVLAPGFGGNFVREIAVRAQPLGDPGASVEVLDAGAIQHVRWPSGDPRLNPIEVTEDGVDATLGATLGGSANVRVLVENGEAEPLPIRSVVLEMRERRVCFAAAPGARYLLRYGDPALAAPVYDTTALLKAGTGTAVAELGPEERNPRWRARLDSRTYFQRHPELFWLLVIVSAGMMAGTGLQFVQHRGGAGRG